MNIEMLDLKNARRKVQKHRQGWGALYDRARGEIVPIKRIASRKGEKMTAGQRTVT